MGAPKEKREKKHNVSNRAQVHGLGTAMKILFADEGPDKVPLVRLTRNEVVALFNTLAQYVLCLHVPFLSFAFAHARLLTHSMPFLPPNNASQVCAGH